MSFAYRTDDTNLADTLSVVVVVVVLEAVAP